MVNGNCTCAILVNSGGKTYEKFNERLELVMFLCNQRQIFMTDEQHFKPDYDSLLSRQR